ncbi:hypothetical protein FRB94_010025 [Tulasnella sp. JGI-2019a]|nr:hypothetical protein FRB93_011112 [Tulasnella sp. JGI-2019a]KAG9010747.1 hypothetical protein FRB94_010025 [Tulasnella sp. JGI-2019a]
MVKFFSQTHKYDDAWATVTLAFFLRYPNPYASHVLACDVISRTVTESGTLKTTRLIKKTGAVPSWFPKQFMNRPETWVVEESEVDPEGRVMSCRTRNLDHVKVMQVQEDVILREADDNKTYQKTTASIVSNFGWGLTKKIELYGITKFKANLERSRQGVVTVLSALRESRQRFGFQPLAYDGTTGVPAGTQDWTPSTSSATSALDLNTASFAFDDTRASTSEHRRDESATSTATARAGAFQQRAAGFSGLFGNRAPSASIGAQPAATASQSSLSSID